MVGNHLYRLFIDQRDSQLLKATSFESHANYEMAYLALWTVVEKNIKLLQTHALKKKLLEDITAWKLFLEGASSIRPSDIRSFTYESSVKIPSDLSTIEQLFCPMPKVRSILNTDYKNGSTKWRDKRNRIAHDAEAFPKPATFSEYKKMLLEGIQEIENAILRFEGS